MSFSGAPFQVFAKLEGFNPGRSIKDRTALSMLLYKISTRRDRPRAFGGEALSVGHVRRAQALLPDTRSSTGTGA